MASGGIETIYQKPNTSRKHPGHKIYPYLLKNLAIVRVNQVWSADITYIPMAKGFIYLTAIMDWFSRRVLAWRVSITMESDFCVDALTEAMEKYGSPEIFNTDQGVQFTCASFIDTLAARGVRISHRIARRDPSRIAIRRQGAHSRQHLHRTALAQFEIRRGLSEGLHIRR